MTTFARWLQRLTLVRVVGSFLVLAGLGISATAERSLIDYRQALAQHTASSVLDLGAGGRPQAGQYGSTTRVAGLPKVVEAPRDEAFGQRAESPVLVRHVEMFQWREIRVGSMVTYELDWVDHPVNASTFDQPRGHANPGAFPVEGKQFDAGQVLLGNFVLSPAILHALPGTNALTPDMKSLPANFAATFQLYDGALVTSAHPGNPRLGDLRVSWSTVPLQEITVLARIDGDTLVPSTRPDVPSPGFDVQVGDRSLVDVIPGTPEEPGMIGAWRMLAIVLVTLGVLLLAQRQRMHHDVLFAVGAAAITIGAITCVLWLAVSIGQSAAWLLLCAAGVALASWRVHCRSEGD
ncbi:TMEM43 family protein [Pinirhizobacter sp.]|jgi:hypothetical protein|uniref:TMEM43 family protein n=1 Tax=Pinirhizobacter sp. TaxID=2950432 RepID=UPI002F412857